MIYLDRKFINLLSPQLSQFKQKNTNLFVFRCPICGDSRKDDTKARGYVFAKSNSLIFKCHNCGDSRSLKNLIEHVSPTLYQEYVLEEFANKQIGKTHNKFSDKLAKTETPNFVDDTPSKVLLNIKTMSKINDLTADHDAVVYLKKRMIPESLWNTLFFVEDDHELENVSPKYKDRISTHHRRLIVPFTNTKGAMTGFTGRAIDSSNKLRYLTIKLQDDVPMIYGLDRWDRTKYTYITEGQFDSMFLPNALSVGGSDLAKATDIIDKYNTVFILDREPRNKDIINKMNSLILKNFYVCILPDIVKGKDINEMVLHGYDVKTLIDKYTFRGLAAETELVEWKRV